MIYRYNPNTIIKIYDDNTIDVFSKDWGTTTREYKNNKRNKTLKISPEIKYYKLKKCTFVNKRTNKVINYREIHDNLTSNTIFKISYLMIDESVKLAI